MFIVLLRLAQDRSAAAAHIDAHKAWIADGFADGVFLMVGNLEPAAGGCVLAHHISRTDLETRIEADPFVAHQVVEPEIIEVTPGQTDERVRFLHEDVAPRHRTGS